LLRFYAKEAISEWVRQVSILSFNFDIQVSSIEVTIFVQENLTKEADAIEVSLKRLAA
jgi:hypothetical protein